MADSAKRTAALDLIRQNIVGHGHHVYLVSGGQDPRFAYTIGLRESLGYELILAGSVYYMAEDVMKIVNDIAANLKRQGLLKRRDFQVEGCGSFSLSEAHGSWTTPLMLGTLDYYQIGEVAAYQIVPDSAHWTIDVPDMIEPWSAKTAPVWQWIREPWTYAVSPKSHATTNLAALRGQSVTEATRWEENYWELVAGAGPDVIEEETRVVPLGTLLAADKSLEPIVRLSIGGGIWREAGSEWHTWGKSEPANE